MSQRQAGPDTIWHTLSGEDTLGRLGVRVEAGLSTSEAEARLREAGPNELVERGLKSPLLILWEQLTATMVVILIIAAIVAALVGETKSVIAILAIVILNAILGFVQEYRAERAMAALRRMAAPLVRVRREGRLMDVEARQLVPGDVILLEAGSIVPADARLIEAASLRVQEASLTGESLPVDKAPQALVDEHAPLGDRHNMLYMGTAVTYGRSMAVVVETGMRTELGRIAELIQGVAQEKTPLQKRMSQLGNVLAVAAFVIVGVVFGLGLLRGKAPAAMLLNAVAVAVAVVPEGLPAVVTIGLALGAQRMLRRRALIRKLPAVETLGSVTVIASDKTGTLTENRMTVKILDVAGNTADVIEVLRDGHAMVEPGEQQVRFDAPEQALLLAGGALCNDAVLERVAETPGEFTALGDPTEGALVVAAARFGLWKPTLDEVLPRVAEVPFSSERKRMTTIHRPTDAAGNGWLGAIKGVLEAHPGAHMAFTKGAVDGLLAISEQVWVNGGAQPMTPEWRARIEEASNRLAQEGLRVLGIGFRPVASPPANGRWESVEDGLIFVGMVGMIDPPRGEVRDAVRVCKEAGIRPVMITGDHPLTAQAIAADLGIVSNGRVLTGLELAELSAEELRNVVEEVSVYARVAPEHKLNIVQALQQRGHVVAMTGDGVNDAPALRKADIGVAMGITGTPVSKEAADMVILDDNFATIVHAAEEGRTIYDNVRKFVKYILASNTGEVTILTLSQALGMPLPLTTLQILWMNLITDGLPALALSTERAEPDAMRRPPYAPTESIFARGMGRHILWVGAVMALVSLGLGLWAYLSGHPAWNTMMFVTMTLSQMGHALAVRSARESLFRVGVFSNRLLVVAVIVTVLLQLMVVYVPFFNDLFDTRPLSLADLAICLALSTAVFWAVEMEKLLIRRGVLSDDSRVF